MTFRNYIRVWRTDLQCKYLITEFPKVGFASSSVNFKDRFFWGPLVEKTSSVIISAFVVCASPTKDLLTLADWGAKPTATVQKKKTWQGGGLLHALDVAQVWSLTLVLFCLQ